MISAHPASSGSWTSLISAILLILQATSIFSRSRLRKAIAVSFEEDDSSEAFPMNESGIAVSDAGSARIDSSSQ